MSRHLGIFVGFVACGFVASFGFAQDESPKLGDSTQIQQNAMLNQQLIDDIKAIRQEVGGSIAEKLKDLGIVSSSKNEAEQEFDRELKRLATQAGRVPQIGPSAIGPPKPYPGNKGPFRTSPSVINWPKRFASSPSPPHSPFSNVPALRFPATKPSPIDRIRDAARRLEDMAADLEAANLYGEADEIRDQARKFWLRARELTSNSN